MATAARPLIQWMRWHRHCCFTSTFHHHLLHSPYLPSITPISHRLSLNPSPSLSRNAHSRSRGPYAPLHDFEENSGDGDSGSNSDSDERPSRNAKKREAKRAVRWGMDLSTFSPPQIKRILRAASFEQEVYDALILVKRFGRDVREGKRRQFNYIGRLLREADPELMDSLIQATRDSDHSKLRALAGLETDDIEDEDADDGVNVIEDEEDDDEEEEVQGVHGYIDTATRWFDGLITKDVDITKEIYSIHSVEFDRQELRKLVRKLQSAHEQQGTSDENEGKTEAAILGARKALTRFLRALAKSLPAD